VSRHYLIDGYNLLYSLPELPPGNWEAKRSRLLERLAAEKPFGNNRATVVFDSREGAGNQSRLGDIAIVFTAGQTADEWISGHVRRTANPRIVVVVTDDQGLRRLIRGTGAKGLGTAEFWRQARPSPRDAVRELPIETDSITEELRKKWL